MKKVFRSAICIVLLLATTLYIPVRGAADPGKDTTYATSDGIYTIRSTANEKFYYDKKGALAFSSRNITDSDLPLSIMRKLMKRYPDNYFRNILQFHTPLGKNIYFITLESDKQWTVLQVGDFNQIKVLQRLDKI
ncbi:hypothetical protein [Compostibacter hankyongensis]|uniref:Beta-lactamase-inhibitor-like PepSY-like domain-containing protein n=1 Tax=Compostibacter hankyongensis TaxID=1007089 RepID=A0ABP8FSM0_9BACT